MTSKKVASVAAKGLSAPDTVTDEEVRSLAASALAQVDKEALRLDEIASLERLLDARRGQSGFEDNVRDIERSIELLKAGA